MLMIAFTYHRRCHSQLHYMVRITHKLTAEGHLETCGHVKAVEMPEYCVSEHKFSNDGAPLAVRWEEEVAGNGEVNQANELQTPLTF